MLNRNIKLFFAAGIIVFSSAFVFVYVSFSQCCLKDMSLENMPKADQKTATEKKAEKKLPTLLELGSKRCNPCQMMMPILDKLEKDYKGIIKVSFVDVWIEDNLPIAQKYKINIIPTQIFLDADGKELWRHTGFIPESDILKKWKELGYDLAMLKKADKKKLKDKETGEKKTK